MKEKEHSLHRIKLNFREKKQRNCLRAMHIRGRKIIIFLPPNLQNVGQSGILKASFTRFFNAQ